MRQKELSVWLRVIVVLIGAAVIFLAVVFVPDAGRTLAARDPEFGHLYRPCLICIWITVLPVLAALCAAWLIFAEIGRDNSFCLKNAARLRLICFLAVADTVLYIAGGVTLALLGALDPGFFIILVCVVFMGFSLSVAAAALSHLTRKAAMLKAENDLTI